jgi:hypothetical protein
MKNHDTCPCARLTNPSRHIGAKHHSLLKYMKWRRHNFSSISESTGFEPHPFKLTGLQQPRVFSWLAKQFRSSRRVSAAAAHAFNISVLPALSGLPD